MDVTELYVAWRDPAGKTWYPVAKVSFSNGLYRFEYLRQAIEASKNTAFPLLSIFPDLHRRHESRELFPFLRNRVLTRSRPDYARYVQQLGLTVRDETNVGPVAHQLNAFELLSRSGGRRVTDTFEIFAPPAVRDGCAHFVFFTRGVRYLDDATRRRWDEEPPLRPLAAELDRANAFDDNAVQLVSGDQTPIGFVPRYYACEIAPYLQRDSAVRVELLRHNPAPASVRERFLVRLSMETEPGWSFARSAAYDSLAPSGTQSVDGEAAA